MIIKEIKVTIGELFNGFKMEKYSGTDEDVLCYDDKLNCRPSYQRNFIYKEKQREDVIQTVFKGYNSKQQFPLNILYWAKMPDGTFQLLDGQQRTLSLLLFRSGEGTVLINDNDRAVFAGLGESYKQWFDKYELTIYVCEPDNIEDQERFEDELLDWFNIINIAGEKLTTQELRNANYFGTWVTNAKKDFSNDKSKIFRDEYGTDQYFKINKKELNRQILLETVINWKSSSEGKEIDTYMSEHRHDKHSTDLFNYFIDVLNWIKNTFTEYNKEVLYGQNWGDLYNRYHSTLKMNPDDIAKLINELYEDNEIIKKGGIVEYILSNKDEKYLSFRAFDDTVKKKMYRLQKGICPICEEKERQNPGDNIKSHYEYNEMEGDHIDPWSHGGKTVEENCCMLCKKHNGEKSAKEILWLKEYMDNLRKNN